MWYRAVLTFLRRFVLQEFVKLLAVYMARYMVREGFYRVDRHRKSKKHNEKEDTKKRKRP